MHQNQQVCIIKKRKSIARKSYIIKKSELPISGSAKHPLVCSKLTTMTTSSFQVNS